MSLIKDFANNNILTNWVDVVRYGIDYLRLNFRESVPYLDKILDRLDWDNSNFYIDEVEDFTYTKVFTTSWPAIICSLVYNDLPIPFFMYNRFYESSKGFTQWVYARLDFYGSYFRLEEIGVLPLWWRENFVYDISKEDPTITRIDYCVDLFYKKLKKSLIDPEDLLPILKNPIRYENNEPIYHKIFSFTNKYWWLGSWSVWKNWYKRVTFRMYDKLEDSSVKWKYFLYDDYFNWKSVHRMELQFWPSFTRWFTVSTFDLLLDKVWSIFQVSKVGFDWPLFYNYSWIDDITEFNQLHYTKQYVGRWRRFFESWINPYIILYKWLETYYNQEKNRLSNNDKHIKYLLEFLEELKVKWIYLKKQ